MLGLVDWGNVDVVTGAGTGGGFMFTGGTGRFLHASGGGSTGLTMDADGNVIGVTYTGTLFYNASDGSG